MWNSIVNDDYIADLLRFNIVDEDPKDSANTWKSEIISKDSPQKEDDFSNLLGENSLKECLKDIQENDRVPKVNRQREQGWDIDPFNNPGE